jgi:hypothetical protein
VLSTVPASIAKISGLDFQPNKDEYAFIDYLEDGNFTYGYSDYWTAHSLTYLSRGQLTILPIQIKENKILPISWLTTKRWYITRHPNYFVIASKNDKIYTDMINRNISYPADNLYYYKDYIIYQYKSNVTGDVRWFY